MGMVPETLESMEEDNVEEASDDREGNMSKINVAYGVSTANLLLVLGIWVLCGCQGATKWFYFLNHKD